MCGVLSSHANGNDGVPTVRVETERMERTSEPRSERAAGEAGEQPHLVADNPGLIARNLGKQYKRRPVLRNVSIALQRGEVVGLLGPNGAGKTTCFYIITGLIAADYGDIYLDGQDVTNLPMYRRSRLGVGYLPQEPSIFRGLTVEQNIRAVLEIIETTASHADNLEELLAEFSISICGAIRQSRFPVSGVASKSPGIVTAAPILLDEPLPALTRSPFETSASW